MTREEIALLLDLDEGFTSKEVEQKFSQRVKQSRQALAQAGSIPERKMVKACLDRLEKQDGAIKVFVAQAKALEEAQEQIAKADAYLAQNQAHLASVPHNRLTKLDRSLLPQEMQDRIDEIGVIIADDQRKADEAKRAEERAAREAEERVRREQEAERNRREAEEKRQREEEARIRREEEAEKARKAAAEKALRDEEERVRREAELAAKKAAEEAERAARMEREKAEAAARAKAAEEERARQVEAEKIAREEALRHVRELAAKEAAMEEERAARERAEAAARAEAERAAKEAAAKISGEILSEIEKAESALKNGDEAGARTIYTDIAEKTIALTPDEATLTRIVALSNALNSCGAARRMEENCHATLASVDSLLAKGDYEPAADLLSASLHGPADPSERSAWQEHCLPLLQSAAKSFATARLAEARLAQKAGYKAAVAPLVEDVLKVATLLPDMTTVVEECTRMKGVPPAPPPPPQVTFDVRATPCSRITFEYTRDFQKRRLHVLSLPSASFGRSVNADVVVRVMASMGDAEQVNRLIGRGHFIIENAGGFVNIIDGARVENGTIKASTNGVFIDGRRVVYPRSIEGRGETLHIASTQLASHVAHWALKLVDASNIGEIPEAIKAAHPEGRWPCIAGLAMSRKDEMPEDVLFVWYAVPMGLIDTSLSHLWLVHSGDGLLLWDGASMRDASANGVLPVLSVGKLSHIGG